MLKPDVFRRIVGAVARRPGLTLAVVAAIALVGAALALRLDPSASTDTLVNRSSDSFRATERFNRQFGEDPIVILVRGNLQKTVLTQDIQRVLSLEGCLSGNVPKQGLAQLPPVCSKIAGERAVKVVYGPGTFINEAASQLLKGLQQRRAQNAKQAEEAADAARKIAAKQGLSKQRQEQLADQARQLGDAQFFQEILRLGIRYGISGLPSLDNVDFVSQLVFDSSKGVNVPKARFAYLFPSGNAALIQIRLKPGLSEAKRNRTLALVREATAQSQFQPRRGAKYIVTGVPAVVKGLADAVKDAIFVLLAAALLLMAGTLAVVFRTRLRLLPLALAVATAALTFGALSLAGGSLTMASVAALPVLIGLAVDYAIQFQARYDERRRAGTPADEAATGAAAAGGPTIAAAGISTAVGFLVLLLSPVPMVRGFGLMLVLGIALAIGCALTAGFAALVRLRDRAPAAEDVPPVLPRVRALAGRAADRLAGTRLVQDLAAGVGRVSSFAARNGRRALTLATEQPRRVLAIGLAVAVVGWAADTQTKVVSDVRELVPRNLQALKDVNALQDETGVSGEIDVTVNAADLTDPSVIAWMTRFQQSVLAAHGYKEGSTCRQKKNPPELCPALSLPDLFRSTDVTRQQNVRALLDAVPPYFSQAVITGDRRTATLAFGIRLMPLDRQQDVIDDIERRLDPPSGVKASVVGLPVLAADANASLSSPWRRALTLLAALAGVFLVLLAIRRRGRLAAIPLIPIALATGWSALVLFLLRIPLNPMSVTLGALVIAISTEFSVLLSARYREEREAGAGPRRAIELTYASTGAAVLASGATAIAGFAALIASDIRMLRDFGISTVVDLTVSLLGVMVVLPAALLWAEQHGPFALRDLDPRPLLSRLRGARPPRLPGADRLRAIRPRAFWRRTRA